MYETILILINEIAILFIELDDFVKDVLFLLKLKHVILTSRVDFLSVYVVDILSLEIIESSKIVYIEDIRLYGRRNSIFMPYAHRRRNI